jgi:integrase
MSKGDAEQALIRYIAIARGQAGPMPDNPTFSELWTRYRTLKEPTWSTATRKAVVSLFEGATKKKKRPSILAMIGQRRVAELTRDPLQECLNQMAMRGDSFSAVKKARTYITAALEFALDEQLITRNPGRKVELPSKRLRKPCGRFLSLDEVRRLLSASAAVSFRERLIAAVC